VNVLLLTIGKEVGSQSLLACTIGNYLPVTAGLPVDPLASRAKHGLI
jgi:hypothetical protein